MAAANLSRWDKFWRGSKAIVHTVRLQGVIQSGRGGFGRPPVSLEALEPHLAKAFNKRVVRAVLV